MIMLVRANWNQFWWTLQCYLFG